MSKPLFFSLISPTFGRPEEVVEFLESLTHQRYKHFEIILSDGTPGDTLRPQLKKFTDKKDFPLTILYEEFIAVSPARNVAAQKAQGDYLLFLDSDTLIPANLLQILNDYLQKNPMDLFGGPDLAAQDFTDLQKAINFSMTSFITTGGIRGGKRRTAAFHPRGFNMGVRKEAFDSVGGYSDFLCGEDIELSVRLIKAGYRSGLIHEAGVFHKRRTSIKKFYKQVYRFGAARINLNQRHPGTLKLTHAFPALFTLGFLGALLGYSLSPIPLALFQLYMMAVFIAALFSMKRLELALFAFITTGVMMLGYGLGFLRNALEVYVLGNKQGIKL